MLHEASWSFIWTSLLMRHISEFIQSIKANEFKWKKSNHFCLIFADLRQHEGALINASSLCWLILSIPNIWLGEFVGTRLWTGCWVYSVSEWHVWWQEKIVRQHLPVTLGVGDISYLVKVSVERFMYTCGLAAQSNTLKLYFFTTCTNVLCKVKPHTSMFCYS